MIYRIFPPDELIEEGLVSLPPSKSILNRRLIIDALAAPGAPCCCQLRSHPRRAAPSGLVL